jgi:ribosomal protein L29
MLLRRLVGRAATLPVIRASVISPPVALSPFARPSCQLMRLFATSEPAVIPNAPTTSLATGDQESKASLNPHAPIRKFFEEQPLNIGANGMPLPLPTGRPWFARELRLKSFEDLHRLHFVLLIERNKLLNEKIRHRKTGRVFPSPERLQNIRRSMARVQTVLTERAHEAAAERAAKRGQRSEAEQPKELSEAEQKWREMRDKQRKPAKQSPGAVKASGGQKTKRKMALAKEFAEKTKRYIEELKIARGRSDQPEKPRWRNLSDDARRMMQQRQRQVRRTKAKRLGPQAKAVTSETAAEGNKEDQV